MDALSYLGFIKLLMNDLEKFAEKRGESNIFVNISEKSQLTDLNHPVFVLVLVSYSFCMIPLVCALNFGYSNPVDRGVYFAWKQQNTFKALSENYELLFWPFTFTQKRKIVFKSRIRIHHHLKSARWLKI